MERMYFISTFGGEGLTKNAYFASVVQGGGQVGNAYATDQKTYPLKIVFKVCEILLIYIYI